MAIFHITPTTSRLVTPIFQPAFENDSPGADTLIVDQGAFLISVNGGAGALLAATGAWTVTVNGSIVAGVGVVSQFTDGIFLAAGNSAISTITIGADGQVEGLTGLAMFSSANIHNAGTITGSGGAGILISNGGAHTITNSGTIRGPNAGITDNSGVSNDTVTNSGVINGDVALGDGTNHLTNSGTIDGFVVGGNGSDTVTNFAIVADVMKSGTITGGVFLGAGNDKFTGGANAETVQDGDGADMVTLGGGNDRYIAIGNAGADGIDTVRGGAGSDTYDASAANSPCAINLDTVAHDLGPISPGAGPVAANTAKGTDISGTNKDTVFDFENAKGGAASDLIYGSAAANVLDGGGSGDNLLGFGGKDTLIGGAGADGLAGGAGADTLIGGLDGDFFQYLAITDSGITAATRDVITDFQQGSDKIDLSFIDANTKNTAGTNDAFNFVGTNIPTGFSGNPGELHAYWNATGQIVEGDVNGDKKADFSIALQDPLHAITLSSGDFFL